MASLALSLLLAAGSVLGLENGLARTPQMGWNTWNHFGCSISEDTILSAARAIIDHGLKDLGYNYVLMDDCWHAPHREPGTNKPLYDRHKFPRGIKYVADKVHSMGLKLGIYSDAGTYTCGGKFGSLGFEEIDAQAYAEWEIDYLKYDNCYNEGQSGTPLLSRERYVKMTEALNKTGRPILYSMCNWGEDGPWNWAQTIANSWRISGDIIDNFDRYDERCPCEDMLDCKLAGYYCSVTRIIDFAAPLGQKASPGHWNDLDMLEVGNGGMTFDEYVTHFSMWAILKSPLILGNDLTSMSEETLSIIKNKAIIDVNQDRQGSAANRVWRRPLPAGGSLQLWKGNLYNWGAVVALINTSPETVTFNVSFADIFFDWGKSAQQAKFYLYDLWEKEDSVSEFAGIRGEYGKYLGIHRYFIYNVTVKPHQTKVWRTSPVWNYRSEIEQEALKLQKRHRYVDL